MSKQNFPAAERLYRQSLESIERVLGKGHPEAGAANHSLGKLRLRVRDFDGAALLFRRSLAIAENTLPADHPDLITSLDNLALLNEMTGMSLEASVLFERARMASRRHISSVLPAMAEREQTMFIAERYTAGLFAALSFGVEHSSDQSIAEQSASWLPAGETVGHSLALKSLLPKVEKLPGTGVEAAAIMPSISTWAGVEPILFQQQYALERVAKTMRRPKLVSFATHGFFLPTQKVDREALDVFSSDKTRSIAIDENGSPVENPLSRCGLLFSGCNTRDSVVGDDDGILTGLEIVGIDLRGTELVVLSACETGIGDVRNGEGIAGLRQAFQLAGAHSVVSSLWQVPDRESSQIMIDFFANLAAGQNRATSLRNAQLKMIESRREFFGAAHPVQRHYKAN